MDDPNHMAMARSSRHRMDPPRVLLDVITLDVAVEEYNITAGKASTKIVPYSLNLRAAVKKKLQAANNSDLYIVRADSNHILLRCQAGIYELIRKAIFIHFILRSKHGQACDIDIHKEGGNGLVCQTTVRVKNSNDTTRYTINLYHTKSSLMVNGQNHKDFKQDWSCMMDMIKKGAAMDPTILNDHIRNQLTAVTLELSRGKGGHAPHTLTAAVDDEIAGINHPPRPSSTHSYPTRPGKPGHTSPPTSPTTHQAAQLHLCDTPHGRAGQQVDNRPTRQLFNQNRPATIQSLISLPPSGYSMLQDSTPAIGTCLAPTPHPPMPTPRFPPPRQLPHQGNILTPGTTPQEFTSHLIMQDNQGYKEL